MIRKCNVDPSTLKEKYHTYLMSEEFDVVRQEVFERDGYKCCFCGCKNADILQPHHIWYDDWGNPDSIVTLCKYCHQIVTDAVNKAKAVTVSIPQIDVSPSSIEYTMRVISEKIAKKTESEEGHIVSEALYKIWVRSQHADTAIIKIRRFDVMESIAYVIIESILAQAYRGGYTSHPTYKQETVNRTMQHMAESYNKNVMQENKLVSEFQQFYKLSDACLAKVQNERQICAESEMEQMTLNGFFKVDRGILEWEWFKDHKTLAVWIWILASVNFKSGHFRGEEIQPGEVATSIDSIAISTALSPMQVRTALKHLKLTGEITSRIRPKYQVITVINWEKYQNVTGKQQADNRQITGKQQADNNNLRKKERKKDRRKEDVCVPTQTDCEAYFAEHGRSEQDAGKFYAYNNARGWMIGATAIANWQSAADMWIAEKADTTPTNAGTYDTETDDFGRKVKKRSGIWKNTMN